MPIYKWPSFFTRRSLTGDLHTLCCLYLWVTLNYFQSNVTFKVIQAWQYLVWSVGHFEFFWMVLLLSLNIKAKHDPILLVAKASVPPFLSICLIRYFLKTMDCHLPSWIITPSNHYVSLTNHKIVICLIGNNLKTSPKTPKVQKETNSGLEVQG